MYLDDLFNGSPSPSSPFFMICKDIIVGDSLEAQKKNRRLSKFDIPITFLSAEKILKKRQKRQRTVQNCVNKISTSVLTHINS